MADRIELEILVRPRWFAAGCKIHEGGRCKRRQIKRKEKPKMAEGELSARPPTIFTAKMTETRNQRCDPCPKEGQIERNEARLEYLELRLCDLHLAQEKLLAKLDELIPAIARLEVKAGVWGGVGGLLAVALTLLAAFLRTGRF